jgi:2Fe-2S iron-sulfur cluster binding domain
VRCASCEHRLLDGPGNGLRSLLTNCALLRPLRTAKTDEGLPIPRKRWTPPFPLIAPWLCSKSTQSAIRIVKTQTCHVLPNSARKTAANVGTRNGHDHVTINGEPRQTDVPADMPLLWVLCDVLGLTGTKFGCGVAQCAACTVHLCGKAVQPYLLPVGRTKRPRRSLPAPSTCANRKVPFRGSSRLRP